ncbi:UNVERIFIED_CONTAM: hypothetical protein GTU68_020120, partial [Idotea baltica]|nr:hypothetical protein [Idotea baltica]
TLSLPVYLGETIQPEIRGTLGLLPTTIGNIGILICFLVGSYVNWSWLAYIGSLIPLLFFCLMIFVPETPRWYVSKGREEHAEKSLQWLRGTDNDVEFELEAIQKNFEMSASEKSSIRDLFKKQYSKALGIAIGLMLVQQLSGINAVIFYTVDIFKLSGSKIDGNLSTIIVGIVNFMSTFLANILIDKLGRKILLYISDVAMIVSLFSLGSYFY